jgi:hypothetical protein
MFDQINSTHIHSKADKLKLCKVDHRQNPHNHFTIQDVHYVYITEMFIVVFTNVGHYISS